MYKATAKDVKALQRWGQDNPVVKKLIDQGAQPQFFQTGYYSPSNANWAWQIGLVEIGGKPYELLFRFGSVEGGRLAYLPKYTAKGQLKR